MKCRICEKKATIKLPQYNLKLCDSCFLDFFKKRVKKTIDSFKMFSLYDDILIAVSGGKDSLVLWSVLSELGYRVSGLHIDLGIEGYSEFCKQKVLDFSESRGLPLKIIGIKEIFGVGIKELARIAKRASCRICGMIRRYLINREAKDFYCVVTGHTLDDEASSLLGNVIHWHVGFLKRQYPVLEENGSLKRKAKPFSFVFENEIVFYAKLKNIDFVRERCPLSKKATSYVYKSMFSFLEERMPHIKLSFYKEFLKRKNYFFSEEKEQLKECKICGYLTVTDICNFCKLKKKVEEYQFQKA